MPKKQALGLRKYTSTELLQPLTHTGNNTLLEVAFPAFGHHQVTVLGYTHTHTTFA